ncbi:MAG: tRNA (adenosine(37)-N6)-dimethylallyltransferase MiaA, partial [Candidatus Dormibacteraeota bacterium]|nr:tRNA (adenosine(37)-N6)-dimethylallyltransferase MiaA [Candidatus Dormibacteraeota bacterium]
MPVVVGPTAVGKSRVAFDLARRIQGEIIVADSRQVYRRLEIATNKPLPAERAVVRYHCIDLADPEQTFNVHQWLQVASAAVRAVAAPIVEGGTNLYVDALADGLTLTGVAPRPERRLELERLSTSELAASVRTLDPGVELDFRNRVRLIRAIEVLEVAGAPLHRLRSRLDPGWEAVRIGLTLPMARLEERIRERCQAQLGRGLIEEAQAALEAGVLAGSQALSGTGYAEAVGFIAGRVSREDLPQLMFTNNRRLAKRQLTWLR